MCCVYSNRLNETILVIIKLMDTKLILILHTKKMFIWTYCLALGPLKCSAHFSPAVFSQNPWIIQINN